jgi:hypothetical protein
MELKLSATRLDSSYIPASASRLSTNFANLAKDPNNRSQRIYSLLSRINQRFNHALGYSDDQSLYHLGIDILTIHIRFASMSTEWFPMTETLSFRIYDRVIDRWLLGPKGGNYSSYVRDYDFNILLPRMRAGKASAEESASLGKLHGLLFKFQFKKYHSAGVLDEPLVIVISVANKKTYYRSGTTHPVLGYQYLPVDSESVTSKYFGRMGLEVSYFMPPGSRAPLAFYHEPGNLLGRSKICLSALIAVMDTFESIYRPEIYSARLLAEDVFTADLSNTNFDPPLAIYDRIERDTTLGRQQADLAYYGFLLPNAVALRVLMADYSHLLLD